MSFYRVLIPPWHLLFLASYLALASAAVHGPYPRTCLTTSSLSSSDFSLDPLPNLTSTHFRSEIGTGETRLRPTSLLMNGIETLALLALQDQSARLPDLRFQSPKYPDVFINVRPVRPARDFSFEVAVLCIYDGLISVTHRGSYFNSEVDCFWDDVLVAQIHFEKSRGSQPTSSPLDSFLGNRSQELATSTLSATFLFPPHACTIPLPHVFITAFTVFKVFAPFLNDDPVPSSHVIRVTPAWSNAFVLFDPFGIQRLQPPYFVCRWAIEATRRMVWFLLEEGRFAELAIGVFVDGVRVGDAVLGTGRVEGRDEAR